MKFLRAVVLVAAAACVAVARAEEEGFAHALEAGAMFGDDADEARSSYLRRALQAGSSSGPTSTPTPSTSTPEPVPSTTTPPATTTPAPVETTTAPPTTPAPTTEAPATTTPAPSTTAPSTTAPVATTSAPEASNTPEPTTASPATTKPSKSGSDSSDGSKSKSASPSTSSADGATTDKSSSSSSSNKKDTSSTSSKDSKMSTGTIIAIVGGIVVGVGILAVIAVMLARKRREEDDDPLSPFELSMDKGYNGAAGGYGQQNNTGLSNSQRKNTAANNIATLGGAATVGAGAGVGAAILMDTNTPAAGAEAAGVAYTQFYDPVTSPDSMYPPNQQAYDDRANSSRTNTTNNDTNLWMSAMEPKENDVEGFSASVPPEVSLPVDNNSFVSRNSYDEMPGTSVDIDQSSVLSGNSDLDKEFPDYEDESSRGSYEL